jgi:hypothetical protein
MASTTHGALHIKKKSHPSRPTLFKAQREEILKLTRDTSQQGVSLKSGSSRPDISWIRKYVPVLSVGRALGLRIGNRRARCWRPENHRNRDANPSLHFYERRNRVRCFVCDMRGGHSCVDLVMGFLGVSVGEAVRWIAEQFTVPNIKPGRPVGRYLKEAKPYRVGVHASEFELLVRSGMFGQISAAESRILVTLAVFKDPDSGITQLSYQAIMRYSGVASRKSVSRALKQLQRLHAIQISQGSRVGITRECNSYRATLDDPRFIERCNEVCRTGREQVSQERAYRLEQRAQREKKARDARQRKELAANHKGFAGTAASQHVSTLNTTKAGGLRPPDHPFSSVTRFRKNPKENTITCEGLNLSFPGELNSNKSVPGGNREIGVSGEISSPEALRWRMLQRQAEEIKAKYSVQP